MLAAALLLAAVCGLATAQNPEFKEIACNAEDLARAQAKFNDLLGLDPSLGVPQYAQILLGIEQIWGSQGAIGMVQSCNAFKEYKNSFPNQQEYINCANNPLGLLVDANGTATAITQDQAYGYTKIFNQNDFACASGFTEFANSEDCAKNVFTNRIADLDGCASAQQQTAAYGGEYICASIDQATSCVRNVIYRACGNNWPMQWWGCQWERSGTQIQYPQCTQIWCDYNELSG